MMKPLGEREYFAARFKVINQHAKHAAVVCPREKEISSLRYNASYAQHLSNMIRVLLAEDQAMVRGALSALLKLESDLDVIGSAADGEDAWLIAQKEKPDVVVTDIEMPRLTGLELAQRIRDRGLECKVVILTTFARPGFLRRALDAGVSGYLLKDAPADQLAEALRKVHRGGRAIDPQLALEAWSEADPLNDRERQVLRLAGEGQSAGDIAESLHLSQGTVRNYLSEAIGKLGVGNRIEAYRLARQKGWL
jgi:two-component system response regulator DesR